MTTPSESISVGIVLERRKIDNPWQDYTWRPVAVMPGAPTVDAWRILREGDGWTHFLAGTLDIELFAKETDGYLVNLNNPPPKVFIVLRPDEDGDDALSGGHDVVPFLATVCPHEAQDYEDSGEEIVGAVIMPDDTAAALRAFVDAYHVEVKFKKRKRRPYDPRKGGGIDRPAESDEHNG
jgi:hypothetical protein